MGECFDKSEQPNCVPSSEDIFTSFIGFVMCDSNGSEGLEEPRLEPAVVTRILSHFREFRSPTLALFLMNDYLDR